MIASTIRTRLSIVITVAVCIALAIVGNGQAVPPQGSTNKAQAATLVAPFSRFYSLTDLGSVPQLPPAYGGLTFKAGDSNTLLIGGAAGTPDAGIYAVRVRRTKDNHIIGFGTASLLAKSPGTGKGGIDAGLTYTPRKDVLFYTTYDDNSIGQIKSGSKKPDKQIALNTLGIASSVGAVGFVPQGFPGAGRLKITSYTSNLFYDTTVTPDRSGTYNIIAPPKSVKLSGGIDSFVYIKAGNRGFAKDSFLMAEFDTNKVSTYAVDVSGNPIANTRRDFIIGISQHSPTALTGTIGATVDPVTGDVLFSTFFENSPAKSKIYQVRGFRR